MSLLVKLYLFLGAAHIQCQLATVFEGDLLQPILYQLVDTLVQEHEKGQDIIKSLKKTILSLLLANKNMSKKIKQYFNFTTTHDKNINGIAKSFFQLKLHQIAPKMEYQKIALPEIHHNRKEYSDKLVNNPAYKHELSKQILFCAHLSTEHALNFIAYNHTQLSNAEFILALDPGHKVVQIQRFAPDGTIVLIRECHPPTPQDVLEKFPKKTQILLTEMLESKNIKIPPAPITSEPVLDQKNHQKVGFFKKLKKFFHLDIAKNKNSKLE